MRCKTILIGLAVLPGVILASATAVVTPIDLNPYKRPSAAQPTDAQPGG